MRKATISNGGEGVCVNGRAGTIMCSFSGGFVGSFPMGRRFGHVRFVRGKGLLVGHAGVCKTLRGGLSLVSDVKGVLGSCPGCCGFAPRTGVIVVMKRDGMGGGFCAAARNVLCGKRCDSDVCSFSRSCGLGPTVLLRLKGCAIPLRLEPRCLTSPSGVRARYGSYCGAFAAGASGCFVMRYHPPGSDGSRLGLIVYGEISRGYICASRTVIGSVSGKPSVVPSNVASSKGCLCA